MRERERVHSFVHNNCKYRITHLQWYSHIVRLLGYGLAVPEGKQNKLEHQGPGMLHLHARVTSCLADLTRVEGKYASGAAPGYPLPVRSTR